MGCTVRDKHVRTNRKTRPSKSEIKPSDLSDEAAISKSVRESSLSKPSKESNPQNPRSPKNPNPNASGPNSGHDESAWGYCTEEQLEEILMKNLEYLYSEAISRLVILGYEEDVALKAILRNGHCYGGMDVLTNILHNSLAYLNSNGSGNSEDSEPVFEDLRQLEGYSLAGMVRLLQQFRPQLSNGDAMWCLLMSDLHVGRASAMEIPVLPLEGNSSGSAAASGGGDSLGAGQHLFGDISPSLCRFHSGWGFGNGGCCDSQAHGCSSNGGDVALQREVECPDRFNLSPAMKVLLKKNVAMFAAGFRANMKQSLPQGDSLLSKPPTGTPQVGLGSEVLAEKGGGDSRSSKNQDAVNSVLSKFQDLNLDENSEFVAEDQKDEMIVSLLHQIKDLEKQVKERKDWAQQKAMQAATKLSNDLRELKMLRMEREETQKLKKGKQTLEDATMKRLSEMENALRKASSQVDRANASVKRLETENAEIRAEMEACKLSTAESVSACSEVAKREKKNLKRLLAWEKQRAKLQEEIDEEREKIAQVKQNIAFVNQCKNDTEVR